MAAQTGHSPACGIPISLQNMLDVLMDQNGLKSWQIYSEKFGVTVKLRFGQPENGGQVHESETNSSVKKVSYTKKSPSQLKRDQQKACERRITRSKGKDKSKIEENDCELPRNDNSESITSPITSHAFSPIHVHETTPEQPSLLIESHISDHDTSGNQHTPDMKPVDPDLGQDISADCMQQSTPLEGLKVLPVEGTDTSEDDTSDSDDELGANASLELKYHKYYQNNPRPKDRRCSYCGNRYGYDAKNMRQCTYPGCGRKLCEKCFGAKRHFRHKKRLILC